MRGIVKLTQTQAKLFLREPAAFFFTLVFPAGLLYLFGLMFGNDPDPEFNPNFGFLDVETPAFMALVIASIAFMGIPTAVAAMREQGVLRRLRATPLPSLSYILADLIVNYGMGLFGAVLLVAVGKVAFELNFSGSWPLLFVAFSAGALAAYATGYLIAALSPTARVAQTLGMVLYFPNLFLSGATFPRDVFPDTIKLLSDLMPMTHMVNLFQAIWFGKPWSEYGVTLTITVGFAIGGVVLAVKLFRWE